MKESQFLDTLLPSSPDFQPIIQEIREKYQLPEISPDDDPITEIFLGDEQIPLEDFRQEIKALVEKIPEHLPPEISKILTQARAVAEKPLDMRELEGCPENVKTDLIQFYIMLQGMGAFVIKLLDDFDSSLADMLYVYLLTGETEQISKDWISKVITASAMGEPIVIAVATSIANPEVIVQQFREEYAKTFRTRRPKVTDKTVNTAYYMRLQRAGKKWNYIVEEFIRLNKFSLPKNRNSPRYADTLNKYSRLLRKRMQRSEKVLEILLVDKN